MTTTEPTREMVEAATKAVYKIISTPSSKLTWAHCKEIALAALTSRPALAAEVTGEIEMDERNARVQARYDELIRDGRHGHYETLFRIVREEVERATPSPDVGRVPEGWRLVRFDALTAIMKLLPPPPLTQDGLTHRFEGPNPHDTIYEIRKAFTDMLAAAPQPNAAAGEDGK